MSPSRRARTGAVAVVLAAAATLSGVAPVAVSGAEPTAQRTASFRAVHPEPGVAYHALWGDRSDADRRDMFDRLARMGITWVRISLPWGLIQNRRPSAGDPGWSAWGLDKVDRVVRMARHRGLSVSFTFYGTPSWANGGRGKTHLPTNLGSYARAIRFMAHRYRNTVDSWEIWNEPDHEKYLKGATVSDYTDLLCKAYTAVHQGAPDARVVSGGVGGNDYYYVRRMYRAGAKPCFDVLATHPYNGDYSPYYRPSDGPWWFRNVTIVRRVMRNHGDAAKPIWFTESGWSTHPDPPVFSGSERGVTRRQQAKFLVQMFQLTDARYPYVERVGMYQAKAELIGDRHDNGFALYTYDMRPKPAVRALRTYLAGVG
jgi:hypothetical protein